MFAPVPGAGQVPGARASIEPVVRVTGGSRPGAVPLMAVTGGGAPPMWSQECPGEGGRDVQVAGQGLGGDGLAGGLVVGEGGHPGAEQERAGQRCRRAGQVRGPWRCGWLWPGRPQRCGGCRGACRGGGGCGGRGWAGVREKTSLVRARKARAGTAASSQPVMLGRAWATWAARDECGGGDEDGHRVGGGAVLAFAAADLDSGRGGGQFGDDGVGPAEPASGSGRGVAHGPVVDVGERGGAGHAAR